MQCILLFPHSKDDVAAVDVNMGCPKEFSLKVITSWNCCLVTGELCRVEWEQLC